MAVNINIQKKEDGAVANKFFPCSLCSSNSGKANHNIRQGIKFPSPESKVERLKMINGCIRCGFSSHPTKNCKYRFRDRCINCRKFHWNYLCTHYKENLNDTQKSQCQMNQGTDPKRTSNANSKNMKTSNKKNLSDSKDNQDKSHGTVTTVTEALNNSSEGETVLPTFTCKLKGQLVRGMKDSGCQSNFITEQLAHSLDLPVIKEKVKLTVNGINVSKQYETKVVEIEMKLGESTKE